MRPGLEKRLQPILCNLTQHITLLHNVRPMTEEELAEGPWLNNATELYACSCGRHESVEPGDDWRGTLLWYMGDRGTLARRAAPYVCALIGHTGNTQNGGDCNRCG